MILKNLQNRLTLTLFASIAFLMFSSSLQSQGEFITKWSNFNTATTKLNFNVLTTDSVSYKWSTKPSNKSGSGKFSSTSPSYITLNGLLISAGDSVTLTMTPNNLSRFYIDMFTINNSFNLVDLVQWGNVKWTSMENAFTSCSNFNISAQDFPNLSGVTSLSGMFQNALVFNSDITNWNTSNITDMSYMFFRSLKFNQNIGSWNTSNVVNMDAMFLGAEKFNQNIGNWITIKVDNMKSLFEGAILFNQNISKWNTSSVNYMNSMFSDASSFNQDISNWNTSNVTSMNLMFNNAKSFNQNITNWNTSNVTSMRSMFSGATLFNQNITNWNTSKVNAMDFMFSGAIKFNQNISNWNTSQVYYMNSMFSGASLFNQNISKWNTIKVDEVKSMFKGALAFNQNLGNWKFNNNVLLTDMLSNTGMDCDNYTATLVGWSKNNPTVTGRTLGANAMQYGTSAVAARDTLTKKRGWTITGDTPSNSKCDLLLATETLPFNDAINIYPNPTTGLINITEMENADYTVSDISGKILSEGKVTDSTISIEKLPIGMYFLKMTNTKYTTTKKVWKE
jgi:surface protein